MVLVIAIGAAHYFFGGQSLHDTAETMGALGAIAATFFVAATLRLQSRELQLQRRELTETRGQLERQADSAEEQEAAIERQRRAQLFHTLATAQAALASATAELTRAGQTPSGEEGWRAFAKRAREIKELIERVQGDLASCLPNPTPADNPSSVAPLSESDQREN